MILCVYRYNPIPRGIRVPLNRFRTVLPCHLILAFELELNPVPFDFLVFGPRASSKCYNRFTVSSSKPKFC